MGQKLQFGRLVVAPEKVGRVIGTQGSTIRGLEAGTGAIVQMIDGQGSDAPPAVHYLTTSPQQKQAIEQALADLLGTSFQVTSVSRA